MSGVAQLYRGRLQLANQEVEVLRSDEQDLVHTGRITPVHPASDGISREDDPRVDLARAGAAAATGRSAPVPIW